MGEGRMEVGRKDGKREKGEREGRGKGRGERRSSLNTHLLISMFTLLFCRALLANKLLKIEFLKRF
jgi:hypothetical protein